MDKKSGSSDASKITDKTGIRNNNSGEVTITGNSIYSDDSINNIRDLGGNLREWTLEASNTNFRVLRGGGYNNNNSPSYRNDNHSYLNYLYYGTRLTLYIK